VYVLVRLILKLVKILVHPSDGFVDASVKLDFVIPVESAACLVAIQNIGTVFSQSFANDVDVIGKGYA